MKFLAGYIVGTVATVAGLYYLVEIDKIFCEIFFGEL